jgi:hypothetical protein
MAMLRTFKGGHRMSGYKLEPEQLSGGGGLVLLVRVSPRTPVNQPPANAQQGGSVLKHYRLRRQGTGQYEVLTVHPRPPLLCASTNHLSVLGHSRQKCPADEPALARLAVQ